MQESAKVEEALSQMSSPFPKILVTGTIESPDDISIVADRQMLFYIRGGIVEACLGLLATYYVFMFEYPNSLNIFFIYMQKCILNIQDARKLPASIIHFVNNLNTT